MGTHRCTQYLREMTSDLNSMPSFYPSVFFCGSRNVTWNKKLNFASVIFWFLWRTLHPRCAKRCKDEPLLLCIIATLNSSNFLSSARCNCSSYSNCKRYRWSKWELVDWSLFGLGDRLSVKNPIQFSSQQSKAATISINPSTTHQKVLPFAFF